MVRTIVADPPWNEQGGGKIKRGADKHYNLMKTDDIIDLMKDWIDEHPSQDNQHLYLWVTNNYLQDGLQVIEALDFRYITNIVWAKPSFGLGRYFRGQHEICLFATKGRGFDEDLRKPVNNIPSLITAPKREHSRKPEEFYDLVEKRSYGPYLELFARASRGDNWIAQGNEVTKFDEEEE
jgi:N6-adenosine-specific RNA methylase IME4